MTISNLTSRYYAKLLSTEARQNPVCQLCDKIGIAGWIRRRFVILLGNYVDLHFLYKDYLDLLGQLKLLALLHG